MSLMTIGTVAFDDIETPFGRAEKVVGGACTYISWAASYFIRDIKLVSIVGDDFPKSELQLMEERGVDLAGLEIVPDKKTFFWAGRYHQNMNQRDTLVTDLNVLADFDPVLPDSYRDCDYVMLGNLTPEIQLKVIRQLDRRPKIIALDTMNFWMDVAMDGLLEVLREVDLLTINDEEARQLSGEYSLIAAARKIFTMGPRFLVVKKGEHGALLFAADRVFYAPALPLTQVKDPTGAGDTFAGGFMGYLAKTDDTSFDNLKRAIIYGSAMASFCVEEFSLDRLKTLDETAIQHRVKQFADLVHFEL
ncbi:MAG TPA: PfkB family carbohydrate kinase [Saprospiraceae bacterium]|nr:bifunctional hydroxymethylpyrimidine kinase/phosphomethylpyrimidine kinase [Lewinellaceae bacterium]HPG05845.1 PfkB family carbohydrate kinase [Saprospiraceae bacterium]HPR01313.1 PfkB family carbohydrate kinase [Saprospiraceae bacterium]HQU53493.1 PfkB family carbohydrate kinase [Saprospiraceae bacterium]HRV85810.1 PfkB family carbohydrate kinase [Saprospiraceae bacterium]